MGGVSRGQTQCCPGPWTQASSAHTRGDAPCAPGWLLRTRAAPAAGATPSSPFHCLRKPGPGFPSSPVPLRSYHPSSFRSPDALRVLFSFLLQCGLQSIPNSNPSESVLQKPSRRTYSAPDTVRALGTPREQDSRVPGFPELLPYGTSMKGASPAGGDTGESSPRSCQSFVLTPD